MTAKSLLAHGRWFATTLARQFVARRCMGAAAALTFTTLVALVPFMAVIYRVLSLLPGFDGTGDVITGFVFHNFVAGSSDLVLEKLREFSVNANQLTLVGVVFVFATTMLLMTTVARTFNAIWDVADPRGFAARFFSCWGVVTLGVPLIGIAVAAASYDFGLSFLADYEGELLAWLPPLATAATFSLLYYAVPMADVRLRHALAGGVATAAVLEGAKAAFAAVVPLLQQQFVYGAFAALPLFLSGLYLLWALVLAGAVLVHTLALRPVTVGGGEPPPLLGCLAAVRALRDAHADGRALAASDLHAAVALPDRGFERIVGVLEETGLAIRAGGPEEAAGGEDGRRWVLGRSLRQVTLWDLCRRLPEGLDDGVEGGDAVARRLRAFGGHVREELGVDLEDVLE